MDDYLRRRRAGGTFFFTARLAGAGGGLLTDRIDALRHATRGAQSRRPFAIDAIAVLPDTVHAIWTLPQESPDFGIRWSDLKASFQRAISHPPMGGDLWLPLIWQFEICTGHDMLIHRRFVHESPVAAGLCKRAADWPHSSIHRDAYAVSRPVPQAMTERLAS